MKVVNLFLPFVLLMATCGLTTQAQAYNICDDDGACTHEIMTKQALDLYYDQANLEQPSIVAMEILEYWEKDVHFCQFDFCIDFTTGIKDGVGEPDEQDNLYDNKGLGGALTTINHFWDSDDSLGAPMEFNYLGEDDYPNAFQAASAFWSRALGEYAAGNKLAAYQYLGNALHFLGDQTIPTHVHNDTHGPDALDDDSYEEWMSEGKNSPNAILTTNERNALKALGWLEPPADVDIDYQLLWLFLSTNQVADYFASDDWNGDDNAPVDNRNHFAAAYADEAIERVKTACENEPSGYSCFGSFSPGEPPENLPCGGFTEPVLQSNGCPVVKQRLNADNDCGGFCDLFSDESNNDGDGDLSKIRKHSYLPGIRAIAGVFALWERSITQPITVVKIKKIKEIGDYEGDCRLVAQPCSGMDSILEPDFYVGITMGYNERVCGDGDDCLRTGAYLEDRYGNERLIGDPAVRMQSNLTRRDAFYNNEDENIVYPDYLFGRVYSPASGAGYEKDQDTVTIALSIWENDESLDVFNDPYDSDDAADINPQSGRNLSIEVDLADCASDTSGAIKAGGGSFSCGSTITRQGKGDDTDDVQVKFAVSMFFGVDVVGPSISCDVDDPSWVSEDVVVTCEATDSSGLDDPNDAMFQLMTAVPEGTETESASTNTREVCDTEGNCSVAGPFTFWVDKKTPAIECDASDGIWHADDVSIACTVTDGGSGMVTDGLTVTREICGVLDCIATEATFELSTSVPAGTETNNAQTNSREVCDAVGNCAGAGPVGENKVDKKAPVISIEQPTETEYTHSDILVLLYTVTDEGSGVSSESSSMDTSTMVSGEVISSGTAIDLLFSLALGSHTFEVEASDAVLNESTSSVSFTIIATPGSIIEAVNKFKESGDIRSQLVKPLLAKLSNAAKKFNGGQCRPAGNIYGAFINQVQAQSGKGITPFAADILIKDAQYLISNC
ncbi:MAG: hypothetical protein ACI9JM_003281 [Halioglobus sp.]|jgi:hypothetical protein